MPLCQLIRGCLTCVLTCVGSRIVVIAKLQYQCIIFALMSRTNSCVVKYIFVSDAISKALFIAVSPG